MAETTPYSSLLDLRNNTEQKSFVMVRIPAQQPKTAPRIKRFVWNWLRKFTKGMMLIRAPRLHHFLLGNTRIVKRITKNGVLCPSLF